MSLWRSPENIATRPIAILGAGTLGRRIALMLATRGAEVRLFSRGATTREEGIAFAKEHLPAAWRRCRPARPARS